MIYQQLQKTLFDFWNGFGVPAYNESLARDPITGKITPDLPYITFNFALGAPLQRSIHTAQIWSKSTGFIEVWAVVEKIEKIIPPTGGLRLPVEDKGHIVIYRPNGTFIQPRTDEDSNIRVIYISLEVLYHLY